MWKGICHSIAACVMTCEQLAKTTVCSPVGLASGSPSYTSVSGAAGSSVSEGQLMSETLRERSGERLACSDPVEELDEGPGFCASPIRPEGHRETHHLGTWRGARQRPTREPRTGSG